LNIEVKVPQLPESVTDATLIAWHHKAGETVRRDENLVDLETDKVVLEVPAPADGTLLEIRIADGATVTSGQVLAVLQPGAVAAAGDTGQAAITAEPAAAATPAPAAAPATPAPAAAPTAAAAGPQRMGPAVRNLIDEHDLDPGEIPGSGREGRITKTDVLDYLARHREASIGLDSETPAAPSGDANHAAVRAEQRVPMTRLRARIAARLVEAQQTAAMLTTFNEIDMSSIIALRARYQELFQARYDIKLGFMSFFVHAAIEGLRQYPMLNASVDGKDIVYHEYFDIGVAVSTDRGLLVPVLRDAQAMSYAAIEKSIRDFGARARSGEIGIEELTGGTFTITNGGIFGSLMSTPILNPPQSGILGMHKIQERPIVVDGEIAVRPMMYLALTYDHRIVDGREAVQFLVHVKDLLEDPARLTLQI
jgi:2-oxoglutarate dehydrogenase E2 component (dihydrolipoamide succinyltransferase)